MKSISQKLESKYLRLRRKLHDKSVDRNGEEIFALRVRVETDMYGDIQSSVVTLSNMIKIVLNLSDIEIPLSRYKTFDGNTETQTQTVPLLFDLLPIEMHSKFYPDSEDERRNRGDIIVYRNYDENGKALYLLLQIVEVVGVWNKSQMRYKKYQCAVATTTSTEEDAIKEAIANLPEDWETLSENV